MRNALYIPWWSHFLRKTGVHFSGKCSRAPDVYISGGGAASPASLDTLPGGPINGPHSQAPAATFGLHLGGAVAQLGERLVRNEEVRGSGPLGSTSLRREAVKAARRTPDF